MRVVKIQQVKPIALSGLWSVDDEIGYGGVDNIGSVIPETKVHSNIWDEEW